jgi:hypothetical protein
VRSGFVRRLLTASILLAIPLFANTAHGQEVPEPPGPDPLPTLSRDVQPDPPQPLPPEPLVAVHGVVKNTVTGEPLPRTLVQVGGETGTGALTDGDGRFDLTVPGLGPHIFQLTKPGFHDLPPISSNSATQLENANSVPRNVFVTEDMPGLSFTMTPTGVIHGRVDLSSGDPGQGIGVQLLRRTIQSGHAIWRQAANARSDSDGAYRFAGLDEGDYAIATDSAKDSDIANNLVEKESEAKVSWSGFAATFYPDAREFSGAARIHLRGGESVQANLMLKLEPFHLVRATLPPAKDGDKSVVDYAASLLDTQGHALSYPAQYDSETRTVQAMLPDGTYSMQVTAVKRPNFVDLAFARNTMNSASVVLQGTTDFNVAGHAVTGLRIALAQRVANPLTVNVIHGSARTVASSGSGPGVYVSASQAGDTLVDGMWTQFAQGTVPGQLETQALAPGSYWVHPSISQPGLCESSFTAGGASLAREPLIVGPGGASAPLALALRDDCAALKVSLPANFLSPSAGEEPAISVFVVPDFDSTVDASQATLRPSTVDTVMLFNLTPGSYHVYAFPAPVELEYRNPEALAGLPNPGQAITLEPSSTSTLVLEAPVR